MPSVLLCSLPAHSLHYPVSLSLLGSDFRLLKHWLHSDPRTLRNATGQMPKQTHAFSLLLKIKFHYLQRLPLHLSSVLDEMMNPILTMSLPFLGIPYFPFPHTLAKFSVAGMQVQSAEAQDACSPGSGSFRVGPCLSPLTPCWPSTYSPGNRQIKTFLGSIFCSCGGKRSL